MKKNRVKLTVVMWDTYGPLFASASKRADVDVEFFSRHHMETRPETIDEAIDSIKKADAVLLYHTQQGFWDAIVPVIKELGETKKIISVGLDPTYWSTTTVDKEIAIRCFDYIQNNGEENCFRLLNYLKKELFGIDAKVLPPQILPWQGTIHHSDPEKVFDSVQEFMEWYQPDPEKPWVGVLGTRSSWVADGCRVERSVAKDLEGCGANVVLAFSMSTRDPDRGCINLSDSIERYFTEDGKPFVEAVVKLSSFLIGASEKGPEGNKVPVKSVDFLKSLDIPFFQPVIASNMSAKRFAESPGLSTDIAWSVALPEFEGMIEPIILACARPDDKSEYDRVVFPDRSKRLAERVMARINLARKPNSEKKVVFFLNNNPCAGLEANVGGASHLDTHQSLANLLQAMKEAGYDVNPPENGKELITTILDRKALSEFRWTTAQEMKKCGGVIHMMTVGEYRKFFDTLSKKVRDDMNATWGEPPGTGMVLDDEIMITGVSFGNAMVAVQPKRGCYGSRCDGEVCKILHDPLCPPTHQYMASYHYYEEVWGADAVMHVGTHGNLEFLPGKGVGMTGDCYPDIGIGKAPHIYIYNADNPPEGTIAKRRSHATLVNHMQTVMTASELYENLAELDDLLSQYDTAMHDPTRAHQLKHMIMEAADKANFKELGLNHDMPLEECVRLCHEALSRVRNSQMNLGMHVFGERPSGDKRTEFINSIMRYDTGDGSVRDTVAEAMGLDMEGMYKDQGGYNKKYRKSNGFLIEKVGKTARDFIGLVLDGCDASKAVGKLGLPRTAGTDAKFEKHASEVKDIDRRIEDSLEIEAVLHALDGKYTPPGPSGLITRGRPDILPTGRNFYSLDPNRIPSTSAWRVGKILADSLVNKYIEETGEPPENVAFFWMTSDLLATEGEVMSQIMHLLGVKPVKAPNGQIRDVEIVPLSKMDHPRIDVTIRTSGIMRDNFINCIDLIDTAVRKVSELDEPPEMNFVRKHTLESIEAGADPLDATARLFCAPPGSYVSGVNLAVYASSWKDEKDLAEIYIASNGYAYGNGRDGVALHDQFASNLSTVSVTYNKIASDEHDLLGCCCYFSNQGGLTVASKHLSGRDVKSYYGDTREPKDVNVHTLADEVRRTVRTKLLNPAWIEGMKEHGYKGASDMMKRIGRVYGWEASTQQVDDWIFDDIATTFVNDREMREFFHENNPYALEEIARRLLEAEQRGLWDADEDILEELKNAYVEVESWLEELAGEGEFQGGSIDIITSGQVDTWQGNMSEVMDVVNKRMEARKAAR